MLLCGAFTLQINQFIQSTVVIFIDVAWLALGIVWLVKFYMNSPIGEAKEVMLGEKIKNNKT